MSSNGAFIIDKNLGARLDETQADLTRVNADGLDVVPPTDEQKYLFDKDGWLLIPGCSPKPNAQRCGRSACSCTKTRSPYPNGSGRRSAVRCKA